MSARARRLAERCHRQVVAPVLAIAAVLQTVLSLRVRKVERLEPHGRA